MQNPVLKDKYIACPFQIQMERIGVSVRLPASLELELQRSPRCA